jgi:diaminohydroxyphosphoribosylaminopyrimidine deaminase/5-amino-6-(5-phosphoribosylamino)uracil reductase
VSARPLVVLKAGITLDGRIADADGRSQWITGPQARMAGHQLRSELGAVMVGSGTLLADDPALNTRIEGGRDALPVILDSNLRIPQDARVLTAGRRPLIFCAPDAPVRSLPADVVRIPRATHGLDLHAVMAELSARGVAGVLVEGGGQVHRSLLDAGMVDRLELFVAPKILAGGSGFVGGQPWSLESAPTFVVVGVAIVGGDVRISMERRDV